MNFPRRGHFSLNFLNSLHLSRSLTAALIYVDQLTEFYLLPKKQSKSNRNNDVHKYHDNERWESRLTQSFPGSRRKWKSFTESVTVTFFIQRQRVDIEKSKNWIRTSQSCTALADRAVYLYLCNPGEKYLTVTRDRLAKTATRKVDGGEQLRPNNRPGTQLTKRLNVSRSPGETQIQLPLPTCWLLLHSPGQVR